MNRVSRRCKSPVVRKRYVDVCYTTAPVHWCFDIETGASPVHVNGDLYGDENTARVALFLVLLRTIGRYVRTHRTRGRDRWCPVQ